jgi:TRAP-type mannitol/chloroaromatic compound transport system permease small subunit
MADEMPGPATPNAGGNVFGKTFNVFVSALNGIGTIWIFVIMILISMDVFSRFLFNAPVKGVPLAVTMSIVAIVFLQMSDALRWGRFTRSDVMIGRLLISRPRIGHVLQLIYNALGIFLMAIIFTYSLPFLEKAWISQSYAGNEGEFTVPEWPVKLVIIIGASVCCIQFVRHFWQDIRYLRGYRDNDHLGTGGAL